MRKALGGTLQTGWRAISPPVAARRGGLGGVLLPRAQAAKLPPSASGVARGGREAAGIQRSLPRYRCAHSWLDSSLPRPFGGRLSEGIMQNKAALFPPPGTPGLRRAFSVRGRTSEHRAGCVPAAERFGTLPWPGWERAVGNRRSTSHPAAASAGVPRTSPGSPTQKAPPQTRAPPAGPHYLLKPRAAERRTIL